MDQQQDSEYRNLAVFYEDLREFYLEMVEVPTEERNDGVEVTDMLDRIRCQNPKPFNPHCGTQKKY